MSQSSVLFVSGEPSGDKLAAGVARALSQAKVRCFGMGAEASARAGIELVFDGRGSAAMGLTEVVGKLPSLAIAFARLVARVRRERPKAAVLVNYTEFNLRVGSFLRALGVPVLWFVAPQIWAWRRSRARRVGRALDRLAVILPFEAPLWRSFGVEAHYVGHPALDHELPARQEAQKRLELEGDGPFIAILPGSRGHEVTRLLASMLSAMRLLARSLPGAVARVLAAGSLPPKVRACLRERAERAGVPVTEIDPVEGAAPMLPAFDASIVASGTASLESALAGVPPLVVYRVSALTAALARRWIATPHIALPNIVLQGSYYPELLQERAEASAMATELRRLLERRHELAAKAVELRYRLTDGLAAAVPRGGSAPERAASLVMDWIAA